MTESKIKNGLFTLVIVLTLLETVFHAKSLIEGTQPRRKILFPYFLALSPSILVYDRGLGYFSKLEIAYTFEGGAAPVSFIYNEVPTDSNNYLEQIIIRKLQLSFRNKEDLNLLVQYLLCKKKLNSISKQIDSEAIIASVSLKLKTKIENSGNSEFNWSVRCLK